MSESKLEQIYKSVFHKTDKLVSPDSLFIASLDKKRKDFEYHFQSPRSEEDFKTNSVPDAVKRKIQTALEKKMHQFWPEESLPCTWLIEPLFVSDNFNAILAVEKKGGLLQERQKILLETIIRQTIPHVERLQLEDQLQRKVINLEAINEIGYRLNSAIELSEDGILTLIYEMTSGVMDTTDMYIALYEPDANIADEYDGDQPELSKIYGTVSFAIYVSDGNRIIPPESIDGLRPRKAGYGLTEYVIRTKKPFRPFNVEKAYKSIAKDYIGIIPKSWMGVPMVTGNAVNGVIVLRNDEFENVYSQDDEDFLQGLANIASVAYKNVSFVENIKDNQKLLISLHGIGMNLISNTDLDIILNQIVTDIQKLLNSDYASIFLFDADKNLFTDGIRLGNKFEELELPPLTGFTARLVRNKTPQFIDDLRKEPSVKPTIIQHQEVVSFAGIPLIVRSETVGVMYINYLEKHYFTDEEKLTLELIGNQAAVAVDNARRIESLKRSQQKISQQVEALKKSQSQIADQEEELVSTSMAMDMVHDINNAAGTIKPWIQLSERLLTTEKVDVDKLKFYLGKIQRDTEILLQKAQEIRNPLKPREYVKIEEILNSIVGQAEVMAYPRIEMRLNVIGEIPRILIEERQLSSALYAIVQNATKAIPNKGEIGISISRCHSFELNKDMVKIEISDDGIGIREEEILEIFEYGKSFWPEPMHGTGYGLWRAKSIIIRNKGEISVSSEVGIGTTFTIFLPIDEEEIKHGKN